ncbi:hypothetical protein GA0070564_105402 [Micromonospora mirobrigensis]|uniref:Uncharacterized protein n=1 Tax=Micromonospora mirobrigensis TaxID=262898 RepID=A0A1C4ZFF2_9ACTN|nr:hypothetical protein GA0070564_105402 [Micromonospora mirobrigensis]
MRTGDGAGRTTGRRTRAAHRGGRSGRSRAGPGGHGGRGHGGAGHRGAARSPVRIGVRSGRRAPAVTGRRRGSGIVGARALRSPGRGGRLAGTSGAVDRSGRRRAVGPGARAAWTGRTARRGGGVGRRADVGPGHCGRPGAGTGAGGAALLRPVRRRRATGARPWIRGTPGVVRGGGTGHRVTGPRRRSRLLGAARYAGDGPGFTGRRASAGVAAAAGRSGRTGGAGRSGRTGGAGRSGRTGGAGRSGRAGAAGRRHGGVGVRSPAGLAQPVRRALRALGARLGDGPVPGAGRWVHRSGRGTTPGRRSGPRRRRQGWGVAGAGHDRGVVLGGPPPSDARVRPVGAGPAGRRPVAVVPGGRALLRGGRVVRRTDSAPAAGIRRARRRTRSGFGTAPRGVGRWRDGCARVPAAGVGGVTRRPVQRPGAAGAAGGVVGVGDPAGRWRHPTGVGRLAARRSGLRGGVHGTAGRLRTAPAVVRAVRSGRGHRSGSRGGRRGRSGSRGGRRGRSGPTGRRRTGCRSGRWWGPWDRTGRTRDPGRGRRARRRPGRGRAGGGTDRRYGRRHRTGTTGSRTAGAELRALLLRRTEVVDPAEVLAARGGLWLGVGPAPPPAATLGAGVPPLLRAVLRSLRTTRIHC